MGATIARLAEQGHDVLLLDMTNGEPTPHGDPETRRQEAETARKILSAPENEIGRFCLGLPNRNVEHTVEARHLVASVIRAHQTDILFVPYPEDAHPDHRATTRIVEDARFDSKLTKLDLADPKDLWTGRTLMVGAPIYPRWLIYYYCTHLRWVADPSFLIDATGYVERKIESIRAYHTQFVIPEKNRRVVEWVEQSAGYFGSRIGTSAAEPFFTKEPLGLTSLESLAL